MTSHGECIKVFRGFWPEFLVILGLVSYWGWLIYGAQMVIAHDSVGYLEYGALIRNNGFVHFVQTGPHREPLYPLLVAAGMALGDAFRISLLDALKVLQVCVLAFSLIVLRVWLFCLAVPRIPALLVMAAMGLSPAIVNSAFSVYSEILVYPFVLGVLLFLYWGLNLTARKDRRFWLAGMLAGGSLFLLTMVKGMYEVGGYLFLGIALSLLLMLSHEHRRIWGQITGLFFAVAVSCWGATHAYKFWNQSLNGHYVVTDSRVMYSLYGNARRRTESVPWSRTVAGVAFIPGQGACEKFFSHEDCFYWDFQTSDAFGVERIQALQAAGVSGRGVDQAMFHEALDMVRFSPLRYTAFGVIELIKVFFWETTRLGFVTYPPVLTALFTNGLFSDGLRMAVGVVSLLAFAAAFLRLGDKRRRDSVADILMIAFVLATGLTLAFVTILSRYSLPAAPVFLALLACFFRRKNV